MQLIFTAVPDRDPTRSLELCVQAGPGTPLSAVAEELARAAGCPGAALYSGQQPLPPEAVLGEPPLRHGAVLGVGAAVPRGSPRTGTAGIVELRIIGGPDAGGVHALPQGAVVVGRDPAATIPIADPDLSRRHVELTVSAAGITLRDLRSTNGSRVEGWPLGHTAEPLRPGELLRIGESTLTVATPDDPPAALRPGLAGELVLNRPPRLRSDAAPVTVTMPAEPAERTAGRIPVLSALVPLLGGVAMAVLWHAPQYLLFTLLSPILLIGSALGERRGLRRGRRRELAGYREQLAAAHTRVETALRAEGRRRRRDDPDLARLWRTATGPGQLLWERRCTDEDALRLRLGLATLPAQLTLDPAEPRMVADVPATVQLRSHGVLGLAGPAGPTAAVLRSLAIQLATLLGPQELSLVLLCTDARTPEWAWSRWLPHLRTPVGLRVGLTADQRAARAGELVRLLESRQEAVRGRERWSGKPVAVLIDGIADLRELPGLARVLAEGPDCGIYAVCADAGRRLLPAECGAVLEVTGEVGTRGQLILPGRPVVEGIRLDGAGVPVAEQIARALAPLRGEAGETSGAPPVSSRLLPLLALARPTAAEVRRGWDACGRTTRTVLGESGSGPFSIDLARDGPHALVAGTTGAGKSELLQTVIAGLALANRPDSMTFVLIDYKGGAAFKDCMHLPHTVGMVTDLDGHLTERALVSLTAELKHREQVLAQAGAKDIEDYWRLGGSGLPRLVLVIDEFASLVEELPDFVTGLVGIAMRGRSLGVHLILATQRPSGVVSPVIRANTNLRIALRVTDDGESRDIIDVGLAARIGKEMPGRAYVRIGSEPPVLFQTARVGGPAAPPDAGSARVRPSPWLQQGARPPRDAAQSDTVTDLQQLVAAVAEAARQDGRPSPRRPWLAPLPERVTLDRLPASGGDVLEFALADHPREQRRGAVGLDLAAGDSMAVVGGPRSGRSTMLRALAARAAERYGPHQLHLHVLDCAGGGLSALEKLPHCGAVCERQDLARGDRVLTRLAAEVTRRQELLAAEGFASAADQRAAVPPSGALPWILVLVDGWEGFSAAYDAVDHGRPVETLLTLAREGAAVGIRVVVTGGRSLLNGRTEAVLPSRIVLRLPDEGDYTMAGLPRKAVPRTMPEGRGLLVDGAVELQVALLDDSADQIAAMARIAARALPAGEDATRLPFRVQALPRRVPLATLQLPARHGPLWTAIGVAGDAAEAIGVDLAADGPGFLVAGPPRSGRSTALRTLALGLLRSGTGVVLLGARRSPLRSLAEEPGVLGFFEPDDGELLSEAVRGPVAAVVDDIPLCTDTPAGDVLTELLRADDGVRAVVGAGRSDELGMLFRGVTLALRASRCGVLLSPGPQDGELLGMRLPRMAGREPPGRGVLVVGGEQVPVQVALPVPVRTEHVPGPVPEQSDARTRRAGPSRGGPTQAGRRLVGPSRAGDPCPGERRIGLAALALAPHRDPAGPGAPAQPA